MLDGEWVCDLQLDDDLFVIDDEEEDNVDRV